MSMAGVTRRPRIAVFSGPAATIQNSPPLVTSNLARQQHGLPARTHPDGSPLRFDALRPQRLAAPVTVFIEPFSAHPLERDAAHLYGPPDGYLDEAGMFHTARQKPTDRPVYRVTLRPEDGLYPLPYMARQADGRPWENNESEPGAPPERCRQPFYPDASRIFEEIDRLGVGLDGLAGLLAARANYDFYRAAASGGYTRGLPAEERTDIGEGDIAPERLGDEFFPYQPSHLVRMPTRGTLARLTTMVQEVLESGRYDGAIWLEGSPNVEETCYWLNLLIDTAVPIVGNASQREHGLLGNDGDRNIVDAVDYIRSRIWADEAGQDRVGVVVIQDEQIFTAREVQKADARPGGYVTTGGHGGIVGSIGDPGPPVLTFVPTHRHTWTSEVRLSQLPDEVAGVRRGHAGPERVSVQVFDERRELRAVAMPSVTILKVGRYQQEDSRMDAQDEVELAARVDRALTTAPLAGLVAEGMAPFGRTDSRLDAALRRTVLCGLPVVRVGRGNAEGFTQRDGLLLGGSNLTATKARMLLMAGLLRYGSLPPAADPDAPTPAELAATNAALANYQSLFGSH
jgi:L-asparaginase